MRQAVRNDAGFTLIEALVAMVILSLGVVGATSAISNAQARLAYQGHENAALTVLRYRFEMGEEGEGAAVLVPANLDAVWRVSRNERHSGQLAGARVRWVDVEAEIVWRYRGQSQRLALQRTEIEPRTATR
jgi:prepilin-type N-terminal cleavage/methylation domain-containing protein